MTLSLPSSGLSRRAVLAATAALAASGFAFASADAAKATTICPPDICVPIVVEKPKLPIPPYCLSCPYKLKLIDIYREVVQPETLVTGGLPVVDVRGFDGGGGIGR
jgi:hypothetical protein